MRFFCILILAICSCGKNANDNVINVSEMSPDPLVRFPLSSSIKFVATNKNDQIALLLERDSANTFQYRIELLRKWKGLPHDYGKVQLQRIESDSTYVFAGGSSDCEVVIKIYNYKGRIGRDYATVVRNCNDDSKDIARDEFPKMVHK